MGALKLTCPFCPCDDFMRPHFTIKKVPAVALGILDEILAWDELFMIPMTV